MAFQFLAAAAGFAEGAAESIEKRNLEIQRNAMEEVESATKQAESQNAKMRTRRDELRATADVLSAYGKFTETQIVGLLQKPAVAKEVIDKLKAAKRLEDVDFNKLYEVSQGNTDATIESTIARMTRVPKNDTIAEATPAEPRGAFGLPSSSYRRTIAAGEKAAGMSLAEMKATARGVPELREEERIQGTLNLSQFQEPESVVNLQNQLGDLIAKGEDPKSAKLVALQNRLSARTRVKEMFKEKGDEDKPRSTAAITSAIDRSLKANLYPYEKSGVIRWEKDNPDPIIMAGADPKLVSEYIEVKNNHIASGFQDLKIIDKNNRLINPNDRNARDALLAHATVDDAGRVSWRKPDAPAGAGSNTAAGGGGGAPVISEQPIAIPKRPDGKADPTKLIPGQKYTGDGGKVRMWNGSSWQ